MYICGIYRNRNCATCGIGAISKLFGMRIQISSFGIQEIFPVFGRNLSDSDMRGPRNRRNFRIIWHVVRLSSFVIPGIFAEFRRNLLAIGPALPAESVQFSNYLVLLVCIFCSEIHEFSRNLSEIEPALPAKSASFSNYLV